MNDVISRIHANYNSLRKSEKKIADYLLEHVHERFDMSITEFATKVQLSETTISRFCRVIGYQSFHDFKYSLASAQPSVEEVHNIQVDVREIDSTPATGEKLASILSTAVTETQRQLSMRHVDAIIDAMVRARQVVLYGVGGSGIMVTMAQHLFFKAGLDCVAYTDGYMQTVTASRTTKDSVVIGVSESGTSKHVVDVVRIAAENGATTIGITSGRESLLAKTVDMCLFTPSSGDELWYGEYMEARACQLYVLDLLYLRLLVKLGDISKQALQATTDALRRHYNPE